MGFQLLDLLLVGIMLISGILAMMRGFTREVLSLVAWILAALAAWFAIHRQQFLDYAMANVPYLATPTLAMAAVGGLAFLIVLIIVSVISVKISDMVVDSAAGGFDRTLGFLYGLARGLVLVAIAFQFYNWFVKPESQEAWVKDARSLAIIRYVGDTIRSYLPKEYADALEKSGSGGTTDGTGDGTTPTTDPAQKTDGTQGDQGYQNNQTQGLGNLIQGTGTGAPTFGNSESGGQ